MKLFVKLLIVSVAYSACHQNAEDETVTRFENFVGSDNFEMTNYFLETMEAKFEATYQTGSLDENYHRYLSNVLEGDSKITFVEEDCDGFYSYELSGMEDKWTFEKYDTMYFDSIGRLITVFDRDTTMDRHIRKGKYSDVQKLRLKMNGVPHKLVHWGKLTDGLKLVADRDSMAYWHHDQRYHVGKISPVINAKAFLLTDYKPSESYFYRLYVLTEMYNIELTEYGCRLK